MLFNGGIEADPHYTYLVVGGGEAMPRRARTVNNAQDMGSVGTVGYRSWVVERRAVERTDTLSLPSHGTLMILPQVHLRKPCYDFCPVQATAIKLVTTDKKLVRAQSLQSPVFSKWLSPGQRRAVCTKGRDVISAS